MSTLVTDDMVTAALPKAARDHVKDTLGRVGQMVAAE